MSVWICFLIVDNEIQDAHAWHGDFAGEHCKVFVEEQPNAYDWYVYEIRPGKDESEIAHYEMVD